MKENGEKQAYENMGLSINQLAEATRMWIRERDFQNVKSDSEGDKALEEEIKEKIVELSFELPKYRYLEAANRRNLIERTYYSIRCEFGVLQPLLEDKTITEIMVNGPEDVFIEKNGKLQRSELYFDGTGELEEIIRKMAAKVRREINEMIPIVDARLDDGSRVNAVYKNIALGGPALTIRKFPETPLTIEELIKGGSLTREAAEFLRVLVEAGYNIFISGGTSSGKTTFLNVLSVYIPKDERVITIEDSAELQISHIPNLVRMECKNANSQGKGQITMRDLIKSSLRMRPDRIIVGEVRGAEVLDMIQAMNTGHDGSLSTGHANSVGGMMKRLEAMFLQGANLPVASIRSQIAEGIDIVIHMGRLSDKKRRILEIAEISKEIKESEIVFNSIFKYEINKGLVRTEQAFENQRKLKMSGVNYDKRLFDL